MRNMGIGLDDMFQYDMLARSIAAGNGYRWYAQQDLPLVLPYIHLDLNSTNYDPRGVLTTFRPPLYPAFLALIYLATGVGVQRFFIARLVQTVLGAALAPMTFWLGRRIFPEKPQIAVVSAWVIAFYPMLILYPMALATENLFFILMLGSIMALFRAADTAGEGKASSLKKTAMFILAGILLGMMALTRSVSLLLAGLAVLWVWFWLRERKMAVVTAIAVAVVTIPWMVRNTVVDKRLTGIESALGYDLYVGYYPTGSGTFQYPQSLDLMPMLDDGQRDALGREKALEFIKADPVRFFTLIAQRAGHFFDLERRELTYFYSNDFFGYIPTSAIIAIGSIVVLPFMVISVCAAAGLALIPWRKETWLLLLLLVGYVVPHLFIIAEERFHMTIVPFLALLAAYFWSGGFKALKNRWQTKTGRIAVCLACAGAFLLMLNWGLELWGDAGKLKLLLGPNGNQTYFSY